jgi:MFS family permease
MNFEELERAWAAQSARTSAPHDLTALKQTLTPEIKRRGRMLRYGIFMAAFGFVFIPVLSVANYRYARPANPAWHWMDAGFWMMMNLAALVLMIRELRRQRAFGRQSMETVRAVAVVALASVDGEMKDFRRAAWAVPGMIAFQLLSLYMKFPISEHGWSAFTLRAAAVLGFSLMLSAVFWRHYHVNLKRDRARQQDLLRELS